MSCAFTRLISGLAVRMLRGCGRTLSEKFRGRLLTMNQGSKGLKGAYGECEIRADPGMRNDNSTYERIAGSAGNIPAFSGDARWSWPSDQPVGIGTNLMLPCENRRNRTIILLKMLCS